MIAPCLVLAACTAPPEAPDAPATTVTVTATATPSASATAAPATSTATPSAGGGCAPNGVSVDVGFTRRIPDIDGDGRADTMFYTAERPLRFGVRTASGATITVADDLPGAVHHGTIGRTEYGPRALIDDSATAEPFAFADCRFTRLLDADGRPWAVTLRRPAQATGTAPTGVVCTDLNGGAFVALARAAKQSDGTWDVWWGILQHGADGRYRADPLTGDPVFSHLPFDDHRVGDAFTSGCAGAPVVYWPDA